MRPTLITVSGLSSGTGKTTLVCELLSRFPGWEAIKVSRGHYRSCGKDPQACCISPMLGETPRVLSGRGDTYSQGKDTGRYWDSGAGNVHWVVCTSEQVADGLNISLGRVDAEGAFIEGTSILKYIPVDYSIMVIGPSVGEIKSSALRAIEKVNALYSPGNDPGIRKELGDRLLKRGKALGDLPLYFERDIELLASEVVRVHGERQLAVVAR